MRSLTKSIVIVLCRREKLFLIEYDYQNKNEKQTFTIDSMPVNEVHILANVIMNDLRKCVHEDEVNSKISNNVVIIWYVASVGLLLISSVKFLKLVLSFRIPYHFIHLLCKCMSRSFNVPIENL